MFIPCLAAIASASRLLAHRMGQENAKTKSPFSFLNTPPIPALSLVEIKLPSVFNFSVPAVGNFQQTMVLLGQGLNLKRVSQKEIQGNVKLLEGKA